MEKKKIYLGIIIISIILIISGVILSFTQKEYLPSNEDSNNTDKKVYKSNEPATVNYIKITLNSSSEYTNYKKCDDDNDDNSDNDLSQPLFNSDCINIPDNKKIQKVSFDLKGLKDNQLINATNFKCIADNEEYNQLYGFEKKEFSYFLTAGESVTGSIYCQIPKNTKNIKIEYISNSGSTIFFEI